MTLLSDIAKQPFTQHPRELRVDAWAAVYASRDIMCIHCVVLICHGRSNINVTKEMRRQIIKALMRHPTIEELWIDCKLVPGFGFVPRRRRLLQSFCAVYLAAMRAVEKHPLRDSMGDVIRDLVCRATDDNELPRIDRRWQRIDETQWAKRNGVASQE
jgi:hypothetical protein